MNYLAHAVLSFDRPEITVGNLISDFVKGKQQFVYPETIRQGIILHRAIDNFTDSHELTAHAKSFFRRAYGLYSGAITDVVYDYFVANDPILWPDAGKETGEQALKAFAQRAYTHLSDHQQWLPERFARMFYYMRTQDWLYHYRFTDGLSNSLAGLARRAAYMGDAAPAFQLFEEHYIELKACYTAFFPALKVFALNTLQQLQEDRKIG